MKVILIKELLSLLLACCQIVILLKGRVRGDLNIGYFHWKYQKVLTKFFFLETSANQVTRLLTT